MSNRRGAIATAKVSSKGQITIPKEIREKIGIRPGDSLGFEEREEVILIRKVVVKSPFDNWTGRLKHLKGWRSDDLVKEMREVVDERDGLINKRRSLQP